MTQYHKRKWKDAVRRYKESRIIERQMTKYDELQKKYNDALLELEDSRMECARLRREIRQLKDES